MPGTEASVSLQGPFYRLLICIYRLYLLPSSYCITRHCSLFRYCTNRRQSLLQYLRSFSSSPYPSPYPSPHRSLHRLRMGEGFRPQSEHCQAPVRPPEDTVCVSPSICSSQRFHPNLFPNPPVQDPQMTLLSRKHP